MTSTPERFTSTPDSLEFTDAPPESILDSLNNRGFKRVYIGGGNRVFTEFLEQGLIDQIWLSVEPMLLGEGIKAFSHRTVKNLALLSTEHLNPNTLLLKYSVNNNQLHH